MNSNPYGRPPEDRPYGEQPVYGQPYPGQPYSEQPSSGQPYSGQPYSGQPPWGQPYAGQPYSGQGYAGQGYPGQPSPQPAYGFEPPPLGSPAPGPYPPAYSAYYPPPSRSNGLALASLITGILGFLCVLPGLVGIGLGIAGLNEAKRTGVGRPMAITGICFGAGWALVFGGLVLVGALTGS